jgi:N-acetylglucosamine-6-phosphate deacetylase
VRLGVAAAIVDGALVRGDVEVADGLVVEVGLCDGGGRGLAIPGLVDLQVNGYAGVNVLDAEPGELVEMGRALARDGVLAYQPTVISAPLERMRGALATIGQAAELGGPALVVGAHLEGPFLSPAYAGAHPVEWLREPDVDVLAALLVSGCRVTMVTLAPELEGATDAIDALVDAGIVIAVGHSDASAVQTSAAFDLGAGVVTHLYNAMRPFHHRDPGVCGAALAREAVAVTLIADGVHVAPEALLVAWRAARGRLVLVSDSIAAAGLGDGVHRLGEREVEVSAGVARTADGALAGSVRPLADGVRALIELGVPIPDAVDAATRAPATLVGRPELSRLAVGVPATLVVLDDAFAVDRVLVDGDEVS